MIERKISEQPVLLGQRKSLVGILTQPDSSERADSPAIIILNTGIIHRVGHHRMHVAMSRALAKAGHTVLRFDFSGIGDSESGIDRLSLVEACHVEIGEVIDWLETTRHVKRVTLMGLCSGADHAVLYGYTDPRVVALVLMEPSIPPTSRYYLQYILRRSMRLRSWINAARGRSRIVRMWGRIHKWKLGHLNLRHPEVKSYLEQVYQNSVDRGIQILAVFTGGADDRQTYREQMIDAFSGVSFGTQLQLEYFHHTEHTFMHEADRKKLICLVLEWAKNTTFRNTSGPMTADRCRDVSRVQTH